MQTEAGNNAFDREVKDKLSELRPDYRPDSWERMAAHLDAAESSPNFDESIAQRMSQLEVPYQAVSWDALSARLDAEEQTEAFDETVQQGLRQVHPHYQPSSWEILAARLELERQRIRTVLHYKTMEFTLLLLLFLTAWQHLPFEHNQRPSSPEQAGYPIAQLAAPDEDTATPERLSREAQSPLASKEETSIATETSITSTPRLPATKTELATKTNGLNPNWSGVVAGTNTPLTEINPLPSSSPELLPTPVGPQDRLAAIRAEKAQAITSPADKLIQAGTMTALHTGAPALLDYGEPEELLHYIRPSERKTFVRIGFFGGPDYNRIVTPPQRIEDGTIYTSSRYTLGYSGGITIGIEHNERWEVETGLVYAARRYQAIPTVFVSGSIKDGFSGYSLQDFELNTFSAPLNFRYNFLVHDKWRIYTQVGAALNVVMQANYYAVDEGAFSSLRNANGLDQTNGVSSASKPEILKRKAFNQGWLDGGNFWENATLYGDLGMGIERYMTSDWGMFVQPHYQHALPFFNTGLGPYQDKIHNFSIRMGLKVRL